MRLPHRYEIVGTTVIDFDDPVSYGPKFYSKRKAVSKLRELRAQVDGMTDPLSAFVYLQLWRTDRWWNFRWVMVPLIVGLGSVCLAGIQISNWLQAIFGVTGIFCALPIQVLLGWEMGKALGPLVIGKPVGRIVYVS